MPGHILLVSIKHGSPGISDSAHALQHMHMESAKRLHRITGSQAGLTWLRSVQDISVPDDHQLRDGANAELEGQHTHLSNVRALHAQAV